MPLYYYGFDWTYVVLVLPCLLLSLWASARVNSTFKKYSSQVSDKTKKEIEKAKNRIIKGKDVFSGNIKDNKGKKRCEEGEIIQDEILLEQMDWFVEGVKIYEE